MLNIEIRKATVADAKAILDIYAYYIEKTAITFEYEVPSVEAFAKRIENTLKKYPYLVALLEDKVVGYSYAGAYITRTACDWSAEISVYLAPEVRKCGIGRKLYEALEEELKAMGIVNLYASIAYSEQEDEFLTKNSIRFHEHMGFRVIGEFRNCGYKFQRWYDLLWVEKTIGEHRRNMEIVKFYNI